jgi:hypothetical protein
MMTNTASVRRPGRLASAALVAVSCALLFTAGCSKRSKKSSDDDDTEQSEPAEKKAKPKKKGDDQVKRRVAKERRGAEERSAAKGRMPAECRRKAAPSATSLGLAPKDFITCLEKVLATMKLPDEAKKPFVEKNDGSYTIADYMSVVMKVDGGAVASMDVIFYNKLREAHGMGPELGAQYAVLAIVFPSAQIDPRKGQAVFKEVDAIGRKTNRPQIDYDKDGIALNASFLPISVRYRFKPKG